eukprot:scaffold185394_cov37-Tisochrysis_lutea.AAC.3
MFCLPDIQLDRLLNGKNGLWPQRVPDEGVTRAAGIRTRNPRDAYLIVRREERQPQGSLRIRAAPWCQAGIEGEGQDITRIYRVEAWTGRPAVQGYQRPTSGTVTIHYDCAARVAELLLLPKPTVVLSWYPSAQDGIPRTARELERAGQALLRVPALYTRGE